MQAALQLLQLRAGNTTPCLEGSDLQQVERMREACRGCCSSMESAAQSKSLQEGFRVVLPIQANRVNSNTRQPTSPCSTPLYIVPRALAGCGHSHTEQSHSQTVHLACCASNVLRYTVHRLTHTTQTQTPFCSTSTPAAWFAALLPAHPCANTQAHRHTFTILRVLAPCPHPYTNTRKHTDTRLRFCECLLCGVAS